MPRTDPLVLVHGGWHDGWAWTETIRHLKAAGYGDIWAPTLLGHGPHTPRAVTYAQIVTHLARWIEAHDLRNVTLLGHSFGGLVITGTAELIPHRIARSVYLSAFVPVHGKSLQDDMAVSSDPEVDVSELYNAEDNTLIMSWDAWRKFIPDAPDPVARAAFELLSPEGAIPLAERVQLPDFHDKLDIPQSVITLEGDTLMPWESFARRLTRVDRAVTIRGSHEVMFSAPNLLADAIARAAYGAPAEPTAMVSSL